VRLRIDVVMAVLAAALLLPGLARAEDGAGTPTGAVAATVTGFSDGNGVPISVSTNGFADGNGAPTVGSTDGFSDGNDGAVTGTAAGSSASDSGSVAADFGMSDGNG
jgi:hypothetical protein